MVRWHNEGAVAPLTLVSRDSVVTAPPEVVAAVRSLSFSEAISIVQMPAVHTHTHTHTYTHRYV